MSENNILIPVSIFIFIFSFLLLLIESVVKVDETYVPFKDVVEAQRANRKATDLQ